MTAFPRSSKRDLERALVVVDFDAAYLKLLDAQSATDRLCLNNSTESILDHCDRAKIVRAISVAYALDQYYASLSARLHREIPDEP